MTMKKGKFLLVCSLILISSCVRDLRLNRPDVPLCIVLSSDKCFCKSSTGEEEIECVGYLSTDPDSYELMEKYIDELESRLLKCLNYPKKCK